MSGMDERILEHERLQMEQIRQLDMEELQVEEVDGNSSDDDDDSRLIRLGLISRSQPRSGVSMMVTGA